VAVNAFAWNMAVTPLGMLNLERLEMTPAGVQRGELLATICLAPLEETAVAQKEWSVTTKEFTSIVTDSLENYSETGVTENTELAQSTTSQTQHANQFNVNGTVSGGVGFVTATVSSGFSAQDQSSNSATASSKHAINTTRKAAARVKQEHKVTISTTTVTGTSETTTRTLKNADQINPMRIDYFSLMRRWHVGLYRYGLRLTYDIVIPEPGGMFRVAYMQLADLKAKAARAFNLDVNISDISEDLVDNKGNPIPAGGGPGIPKFQWLASKFGVTNVPPPPARALELSFVSSFAQMSTGSKTYSMELDLPAGYSVFQATLWATVTQPSGNGGFVAAADLEIMHFHQIDEQSQPPWEADLDAYLKGKSGKQYVVYRADNTPDGVIEVEVWLKLDDGVYSAWQQQVWGQLYEAAQTAFFANQQTLQVQIQALEDRLNNVDTLTLRREENDEIMRGVLAWMLGPTFYFMPKGLQNLFNPSGPYVDWGAVFTDSELDLSASDWGKYSQYEEMVRFVNDAVDWDNIFYFLYSYFWDVPFSWENIRNIQHPDAIRQAFLRAGAARVVLTIRKGWEDDWVNFVEGGGLWPELPLPKRHPYLRIAQEIQDYDNRNYPGLPPANPGGSLPPDDGRYVATNCSDSVAASAGPVVLRVASSEGFVVGNTAVIDNWNSGRQEDKIIVAVDSTHNTITVEQLDSLHDGSSRPFPVRQSGEKGLLIAEWFEYTPTSGTDIAVASDLGAIS
jgi:hypothetical protein